MVHTLFAGMSRKSRNASLGAPRRTRFLAVAVGVGLLAGALAPFGHRGTLAAPPTQRNTPCTSAVGKVVSPADIRLCEAAEVTVTLSPTCPGSPINIVLIIDEVYKVGYSDPADRTQALRNAVNRLQLSKNPHIRIAVVWMQNARANLRLDFTNDTGEINSNLSVPPVSRFDAPPQCFECGFREAVRALDSAEKDYPNTEISEIVVLAPLGVYDPVSVPGVMQGANMAKGRGATVISTCFAWTHCDPVLRRAASQARLYLAYGEGARLGALLNDVVRSSVAAALKTVQVKDKVPDGVEIVPGSLVPAPVDADLAAGTARWEFTEPFTDTYTITYQVRPLALGVWPLGEGALVEVEDNLFRTAELMLPAPLLTASLECPLEPTPTPTATTPPTATATATITPVPTSRPGRIFLPIAVREQCRDLQLYADVVLVLDVSTSMRSTEPDGRTKWAEAVDAASLFVRTMSLGDAADRVAIVGFNRDAWIAQRLSGNRAAVDTAIAGLGARMAEHTRLDLAVKVGADALGTPVPGREQIMILLTDGLPNQVPYAEDGSMDTTILRAARTVKAGGVTIYTVALGRAGGASPEVNVGLLREVASRPDTAYTAAEASALEHIYHEIAVVIPCGAGPYWPEE